MKKTLILFIFSISILQAYIGCYSQGCTVFIDNNNSTRFTFTSTGVQYRWIGSGMMSDVEEIQEAPKLKIIIITLESNCDASSKEYGRGKWSWSNGGFTIEFKNEVFAFGRQELEIQTDEELGCQMKYNDY